VTDKFCVGFRWISPASKPDGLSASRNPSGLQDWTKNRSNRPMSVQYCLFTKDANGGGGVIPHCLSADSGAGVGGSQPMIPRRRLLYRVWQHRPWFWEVLQGGLLCRHRSPVVVSGCWRFDALTRFRSHSRPVANYRSSFCVMAILGTDIRCNVIGVRY